MNNYRINLFSILLLFTLPCVSQQAWTLQQCVDHALKNNISVKQSELNVKQAEITRTQKAMQMAPSLNGSASHSYNYGRSVDPFSYTFTTEQIQSDNISLNANLTLFNGFQLQNELRQSKLDFLSSSYDLQKIRNDISLNVVSAFLQVLYAKEQLIASRNQAERSVKQRDRTKILSDAGSLTQGNFLDAEAQLATDELNVITAENTLTIALLSLAQLLELESVDNFDVAPPESELPDLSIIAQTPQSIYKLSEEHLPEIKSVLYKKQSAEKSLSIARGARFPRLSAFGSLGSGYSSASQRFAGQQFAGFGPTGSFTSAGDTVLAPLFNTTFEDTPFGDQIDQNYNKSLGFSLSIPIFNGWITESSVKRAKINLENAKYNERLQHQQVLKSIQQAHADALGAQKRFYAAQRSVDALSSAFNYTQKKFDAGLISSIEWLTSKNNFAKAESDLLQAKYDYIFRIKVLDFYAGKPLTL